MTKATGKTLTTPIYAITIDSRYATADDRYRAEVAIDAALEREGIATADMLRECLVEFVKRSECENHDASKASAYERVQSAGQRALTEGWRDPNGAYLSIEAY